MNGARWLRAALFLLPTLLALQIAWPSLTQVYAQAATDSAATLSSPEQASVSPQGRKRTPTPTPTATVIGPTPTATPVTPTPTATASSTPPATSTNLALGRPAVASSVESSSYPA